MPTAVHQPKRTKQEGFTFVELLIVIVVIAILAAISVVTYNGIQERARDAQRKQDVKTIAKALEMYYLDHGAYPSGSCGSSCPDPKQIGVSWATTSDGSWSVLEAALVPEYLSELPADPKASTHAGAGIYGNSNYDYVRWAGCTGGDGYARYLLAYVLEASAQEREVHGECEHGSPASYISASEYIVVK